MRNGADQRDEQKEGEWTLHRFISRKASHRLGRIIIDAGALLFR
jgi:hypothetical protein